MVKVPLVKGLTEASATAKLVKFGFSTGVRYSGTGDCLGTVTSQSPVAGTFKEEGSTVRIVIAQKACPTPTPSPTPSPSPSPTI